MTVLVWVVVMLVVSEVVEVTVVVGAGAVTVACECVIVNLCREK